MTTQGGAAIKLSRRPEVLTERCQGCKNCLRFCKVGVLVYDKASRSVRVHHRRHCPHDCRTCARLCPAGAITFPDEEAFISYLKSRLDRHSPIPR